MEKKNDLLASLEIVQEVDQVNMPTHDIDLEINILDLGFSNYSNAVMDLSLQHELLVNSASQADPHFEKNIKSFNEIYAKCVEAQKLLKMEIRKIDVLLCPVTTELNVVETRKRSTASYAISPVKVDFTQLGSEVLPALVAKAEKIALNSPQTETPDNANDEWEQFTTRSRSKN
jgi:hypothetical protein